MIITGAASAVPSFGGKDMLKKYRMPNGRIFQFDDKDAPKEAIPVEVEVKKAAPKNKAKTAPKNKAVKK